MRELPVALIDAESARAVIAYRALDVSPDLSDAHDSIVEEALFELDVDVPILTLREAAASGEMILVPVGDHVASTEAQIHECEFELSNGATIEALCFGAPRVDVIDTITVSDLRNAGFDPDPQTQRAQRDRQKRLPDLPTTQPQLDLVPGPEPRE